MDRRERSAGSPYWPSVTATAVVTVGAGAAMYWPVDSLWRHGWDGTLRYIWEGDPYSPQMRIHVDSILLVQQSMARDEQAIESLEQQWRQVQLNSNDSSLWRAWQSSLSSESPSLVYTDLSKELGRLSYELDQYAYQLDQVRFSSQWRYRYWKSQRKELATRLVALMERVDQLIAIYEREKVR
jgi:hypothetical protein